MMYDAAHVLCALASIGLIAVGALALLSPRRLSRSYGVEVETPQADAFVRATGARDAILGLILGLATYEGNPLDLMVLCGFGVVLSLADFAIAYAFAGRLRSEHGAHLGGAVGFLVIIVLLARSVQM